jgi:hypothetical protein
MKNPISAPDLELAFDVGHSSIGWAVLQSVGRESARAEIPRINILGCGVVTFGADDCLASKRRDYRRQRRHARSTRQRIAQMEKLLAHLKVLSAEQLKQKHQQAGGHAAPWFLAARVLASNGDEKHLLDWSELWDVLRWYAHNRGYDGNRRWSAQEAEAQADDTEKEKSANALMQKHGTQTMAETFCKVLGLEPLGDKQSSKENFKRLNAAFPRPIVENEVRRLLEYHRKKLPAITDAFLKSLFEDWQAAGVPDLKLPGRYQGGLLFGQLVPRFDNRIISTCPISGQKVPARNCSEFLRFRWAMQLANFRVAKQNERELHPLSVEERKTINSLMEQQGGLTALQLKNAVRQLPGVVRDNLDTMLLHPDAKEGLLLNPVQKLVQHDKLKMLWPSLPEQIQKRARGQWRRGKTLTLGHFREWALAVSKDQSPLPFDAELDRSIESANTKKKKQENQLTREALLNEAFDIKSDLKKLKGRAAFARPLLVSTYEEVMAGKPHPKEEGGCLFIKEEVRQAQLRKAIGQQTNNHLVRHRLLILDRLFKDLVTEPAFANGDKTHFKQITIEVNRDLREMSGKTNYQKESEMREKLKNFKSVSGNLEKAFADQKYNGKPVEITAGLIRKARIASDLGWECPYTGKTFEPIHLVSRAMDKDHIIPYSVRPSDSLDSLVITLPEVNRMKGPRTAWKFVQEFGGKAVEGLSNVMIRTPRQFQDFVEKLDVKGHDDDRKRKKHRKDLLLLATYEDKQGFVPRDLTVTSQLVRLGAQALKKNFIGQEKQPTIVSLPGAVTGTVRKGWDLLGCLELAAPQVKEANGSIKNKTDIRDITHLHHALDACVLGLASHYLPNNGGLWEVMIKRNPNDAEKALLRSTGYFDFDSQGRFGLTELPDALKEQIRQRLAEKRVVQHIPADMSGMRVEENTRGITAIKDGRVFLRQQSRDAKTGKLSIKPTEESANKVIGLKPGKLTPQKGVRVITDNFGVAILDHAAEGEEKFVIVPWHKVWPRIQELKPKNSGKVPRLLRIGTLIRVPKKAGRSDYRGLWMVRGVQLNQKAGFLVDLSSPDVIQYRVSKRDDCAQNIRLQSLCDGGLEILKTPLTGVISAPSKLTE